MPACMLLHPRAPSKGSRIQAQAARRGPRHVSRHALKSERTRLRLSRYSSQTALDTLATCYENCAALICEYYAHYYELARDPQHPPPPLPPTLLQDRVARPLGAPEQATLLACTHGRLQRFLFLGLHELRLGMGAKGLH